MARTLDLDDAAKFLNLSKEEVRRRAKKGTIPAAKPGRCWAFLEDDLVAYFRSLYPQNRQAAPSRGNTEAKCSTNVVKLGGLASLHPTGSALDARLEQRKRHRQKNSTIASRPRPGGRSN
ncbi:MAG: helix-turn-helix domain-containing protein [Gammaproteobacteria bacterium]|uniref:DNA binding protein, excisionase family n=2 Tax=Acidithiobacillus ferrooxidans TaxID=920 RepID=B7J7H1_ACIF2|nr:DNA binding protein, excisionase family [Acidithiobacillus ferrooxidans ATCC 23270]MCL4526633.1 helix-turn-helix domain-containing protein [Gammaproteobacteria bacterium]MDA8376808.1 helix-turn-helix domain-containing protein [Planctomycetia bacterium]